MQVVPQLIQRIQGRENRATPNDLIEERFREGERKKEREEARGRERVRES